MHDSGVHHRGAARPQSFLLNYLKPKTCIFREIAIMLYYLFFTLIDTYFCVSKQTIAFIKVGKEENGEPSEGSIMG